MYNKYIKNSHNLKNNPIKAVGELKRNLSKQDTQMANK